MLSPLPPQSAFSPTIDPFIISHARPTFTLPGPSLPPNVTSHSGAEWVGLLDACLSSNQHIRAIAEAELRAREAADTGSFMMAAACAMRDQSLAPERRRLAAILLKNSIGAREVSRGKELSARWNSIDEGTKEHIRAAMFEALLDPTQNDVRRAAAVCISRAGMTDIPGGVWPQAIPALTAIISNAAAPEILSSALWTLGLIAEEWTLRPPKEVEYAEPADQMLLSAVQLLQESCPAARHAAATALIQIMPWTVIRQRRNTPANPAHAMHLTRVVMQNCAPSESDDLRAQALRCLALCIEGCYDFISSMLEQVASCTLAAMSSTSELLVLAALDVWKTVAEHEFRLLHNPNVAHGACHQFVRHAQNALVPALLEILVRGARTSVDDEDGSNLLHIATECLRAVSCALINECVQIVWAFSEAHARSSEAHCRAALAAVGAIQASTSAEAMKPLVDGVMPLIGEALGSGKIGISTSAAWTAGRIAEYHIEALSLGTQEAMYLFCVEQLRADHRLTVQVCYCLDMLLVKQIAKMPASVFEDITDKVLAAAIAANSDNAREALLSTLSAMVRASDDGNIPQMRALLTKLLSWIADRIGSCSLDGVASCLRELTLRLGSQHIAPIAENILKVYLAALSAQFTVEHGRLHSETLLAIGALATALGVQFEGAMPRVWPSLQKAMADIDEPDVCMAGISSFQSVTAALGPVVQPYVPQVLELAVRGLHHRESLDMRLRIGFIACIADVIAVVGSALPDLPKIMRVLGEEVTYIHERQAEIAYEVISSAGKHTQHVQVINLILRAHERIASSMDGAGGAVMKEFVVGMLEFVCSFARCMREYATKESWSLGVKLVARVAQAFPQDLAQLASRSAEVRALVAELHKQSTENEFAELLPMSNALGSVLQMAMPPLLGG